MDNRINDDPGTDYALFSSTTRGEGHGVTDLPESLSDYEDEFPVYAGLLKDLPPTPSYDLPDDELRHIPEGNKDSGWQNCFNAAEKYDRELCQTYREQIDTLLVFAGLFSAVVTAFAVESYQWLQDDPQDTSVELLRDMVSLLSQKLNVTAPLTPVATSRISGPAVTRINTFWFLSLSLSLSAALVGILCKQWLREFERNVGKSPDRALAVRHVRFQGFGYWKVGSIVMSVPILMQVALAFFMIGVIELLWRLHTVVACCVTVVAGVTLVFFLATTFLPLIQYAYICARCCIEPLGPSKYSTMRAFTESQCAYKSAQSWLVFRIVQPVIERLLRRYGHQFSFRRPPHDAALALHTAKSWVTFDLNWVHRREHIHHGAGCAFKSLAWISRNLSDVHLSSSVWHCVWARWLRNRNTPESITQATWDIGSVANSHPWTVRPSLDFPPRVRAQALVFQCSLRADLPVETAIELFLRIAPMAGLNSQWTFDAIRAIVIAHQDLSIKINDGLSVQLFRMAEMQTHALLLHPDDPASQFNGAHAFRDILMIIYRGSRLRHALLAAMSGLALQWLRSSPPLQVALVARGVLEDMIKVLGIRASDGEDWGQDPGIILVAKLAEVVSKMWPEFVRDRFMVEQPRQPPVLRQLLAIASGDAYPDLTQQHQDRAISPQASSVRDADGERSHAPAPDAPVDPEIVHAVHSELPRSLCIPGGASPSAPHTHLCVASHGEQGTSTAAMENDVNCPTPPRASPTAAMTLGQPFNTPQASPDGFV